MTGIYALIQYHGLLEFREGVPGRMLGDTDPQHNSARAFTIQRAMWGGNGLQGHVASASLLTDAYSPNPIATALVAALGGPQEYIFGSLTICAAQVTPDSKEPLLSGLTDAQQDLIQDVHTAVSKEAANRIRLEYR
ncbi:hypothetical protein ACJ6WF_11550 [Streptomyces sp. MMS24-I2-30]|uniref:hypothetical protein n=1 Tax=Streptomyces sp. MMS24-I2-30 TaxID=3351564 RepID=UPI003896D0AD